MLVERSGNFHVGRIDELRLKLRFYGSRRMTFELSKEGHGIN